LGVFGFALSCGFLHAAEPTVLEEGRALLQARAYRLALERFLTASEKSFEVSEKADALRLVAEAQFRDRDFEAAYEANRQSLRLDPLSPEAPDGEFRAALSLVHLKQFKSALASFERFETSHPKHVLLPDVHFWKGECLFQLGRVDQARLEYEKIQTENPRYAHLDLVHFLDAWCAFRQGDYPVALKGYQAANVETQDRALSVLAQFQTSETLYRMKKWREAQAAYTEFLKSNPNDPLEAAALYGQGWSSEKLGDASAALQSFERVVSAHPEHSLAPWAAVRAGVNAYSFGDMDRSRKDYSKALELSKDRSPADQADYGLGWLDFKSTQYASAADHFIKVGSVSPESPLKWDALYLQAGCLYLLGRYADAQSVYDRLTGQAPSGLRLAAVYWSGWCDYALDKYDSALAKFKKPSSDASGDWKARYAWSAGEAAYRAGDRAQARKQYQKALQVNSSPVSFEALSGLAWASPTAGAGGRRRLCYAAAIVSNTLSFRLAVTRPGCGATLPSRRSSIKA